MTSSMIGGLENMDEVWVRVSLRLRDLIGAQKHRFWIEPLRVTEASKEKFEIACPTAFMRDHVNQYYGALIARTVRELAPHVGPVMLAFSPRLQIVENNVGMIFPAAEIKPVDPALLARLAPGSIPPNPNCTFQDFVTGKSNQVAHAAAFRAAELLAQGKPPAYNPITLYGGSGLGKTHLLHAIVWHALQNNPNLKVLFITAETFMRRFVTAMKERDTMAFKDELRSADVLLVDDIQFIAGKESTQEEFFYRFNELVDERKQVILSADRSPAQLDGVAERVRARMQHGIMLEIHPTDIELRLAIIARKLERHAKDGPNTEFPEDVQRFLAARITSNTRELEGAINRVAYSAATLKERVTLDLVRLTLADVLRACDRKLTIDEIKRVTASYFGIRVADMDSPRRTRNLVRPRQIAMSLAKTLTARSYPEIGRRFGNRDHTTVIHAVRQIDKLMREDSSMADDVQALRGLLKDGSAQPFLKPRGDGPSGAPHAPA
jgi:chromosomal replication initiator protein